MHQLAPARTLEDAYRYLDPLKPLEGLWFQSFYVERTPDSRADRLLEALKVEDSEDDKILFSGQQGAGETTELHRIAEELESTHIIIFFEAENFLNLGDPHYTDLLSGAFLGLHRREGSGIVPF